MIRFGVPSCIPDQVAWATQFGTPHPGAGFVGFWWVTPCLHQETMNKCQSCCTKREAVPRCLDVLLECREKTKHIYLHTQVPGPNQLLKPGIDKRFLECSVPWQLPKLQGFYRIFHHFWATSNGDFFPQLVAPKIASKKWIVASKCLDKTSYVMSTLD